MSVSRAVLAVAVLAVSLGAQHVEPPTVDAPVARVPDGVSLELSTLWPDGRRVVSTSRIHWSADGRRVAYVGVVDGRRRPVIDGEVGDAYDYVDAPVFSADGRTVAFRVGERRSKTKERWRVLVDGEAIDTQDWLGAIGVAPSGDALAYWAQPGARIEPDGGYARGELVLVVQQRTTRAWKERDGVEVDEARALVPPVFSADGATVTTLASERDGWALLRVPVAKPRRPDVAGLSGRFASQEFAVTPDASRWAVCTTSYGPPADGRLGLVTGAVLRDGDVVSDPQTSAMQPVLSDDGAHVAWTVRVGDRHGVVVDGDGHEPTHDFVVGPVFDAAGAQLAYVAAAGVTPDPAYGHGASAARSLDGGTRFVVREALPARSAPTHGAHWLEVRDVTFDPTGAHLAYAARSADGWQVVLDEVPGPVFDDVGEPRFTADGATLAHGARDGAELSWRVWTPR